MPREHEEYRDNLADLIKFFEGKRLITGVEAAKYLGVTPKTARKRYGITADGITLASLARRLCR